MTELRGRTIERRLTVGQLSVSIGIAALTREDDSLEMLMARADRALYRAKANGRNRVEVAA